MEKLELLNRIPEAAEIDRAALTLLNLHDSWEWASREERKMLVDCVTNPVVRLEQAGVDFNELTDIIITHFHPEHVSGVPLLLLDMWLMGRTMSINIYGLHYTMDRLEDLMGFYGWAEWPNFFSVGFYRLPEGSYLRPHG